MKWLVRCNSPFLSAALLTFCFAVRFFSIHPTTLKSAERKISKSKEITFNQDEADMLG